MTALRLAGVGRSFGRREVLRGIDLAIDAGACVALHGANGAGKTTLLRIAATDLRPTAGTVHIAGQDAVRAPVAARRHLGVVFQDAPLYRELTPLEHVHWWTRMHGHRLAPAEAARLLVAAGLEADRPVAELSRGQRQRLALVMAMAPAPSLLLLDEPFTALDADGAAWLERTLRDRPADQAVLLIDHDRERAARIADRSVRLEQGSLVEAARPDAAPDAALASPHAPHPREVAP